MAAGMVPFLCNYRGKGSPIRLPGEFRVLDRAELDVGVDVVQGGEFRRIRHGSDRSRLTADTEQGYSRAGSPE
jgi:hypothetical protein